MAPTMKILVVLMDHLPRTRHRVCNLKALELLNATHKPLVRIPSIRTLCGWEPTLG